ncbi:Methylamine utilisation protein MauE [Yersinia intermedia]|uniref:Methylamine utilization protein MauE n=1 Tax=Yersinia intermedia TaxID=631 RepID=A0A0H5LZS3_YERIN|nr:MauE/DoxX family redox-associated membrane protein [Yersinia intermedia]CRY56550.1 Methylamine utilisation protein MauE [Yersinia intermedia]
MISQFMAPCHFMLMTFMALLFIQAALHKGSDIHRFSGYVANYHCFLQPFSMVIAYLLLTLEIMATVLAIVPATSVFGQGLFLLILALYTLAITLSVIWGKSTIDCGCGGPSVKVSPQTVARNLCLLMLCVLMITLPAESISRPMLIAAIFAGFTLWMGYILAEQLMRNSDLINRFRYSLHTQEQR